MYNNSKNKLFLIILMIYILFQVKVQAQDGLPRKVTKMDPAAVLKMIERKKKIAVKM